MDPIEIIIFCTVLSAKQMAKVRNEINNFRQEDTESLFDALERYKDLLRL